MPTQTKSKAKAAPAKKTAGKSTARSNGNSSLKMVTQKNRQQDGQSSSQLEKFFMDLLKDIYWAEKALTKALPKMKKAATTEELKSAIDDHTAQTEEHVSRLEEVFEMMGKKAQAKKCDAMEGLLKEGDSVVEETEAGSMTRDVGIIIAAQKVEHYEIASYGGMAQLARVLNMEDVAEILETTLQEEKEADALLTEIAESGINWSAEEEDEEEDEE
ncbi:MAG: ferritin-like domain-containing protein [Chitinophagaceae bacterium]|nr:MAG: ferritin-like domain-containing protein [Chitinophagaceae bacterium]